MPCKSQEEDPPASAETRQRFAEGSSLNPALLLMPPIEEGPERGPALPGSTFLATEMSLSLHKYKPSRGSEILKRRTGTLKRQDEHANQLNPHKV